MKQSFDSVFAMEDIEVANIMLELPRLMLRPPRFSCTWGCRRKRSVCTSSPPPSKQPLPSSTVVGPIEKVLSSSPDTPLSFCPSEADEKPLPLPLPPKKKVSSVNSLKRLNQSLLTPETHKSLNLGIQSTQMTVGQHHQQQGIPSRVHHQPLMMDQMVQMISLLPSSNSIPDLNVSAEEAFIDLDIVNKSRAAAEARFKRKQICRAKNFKSLYKAGCPLT
ncbi:hypothetical protein E1A91_D06G004300v1 [Gossypium mustelinum]|uniref:Uncharacterized protein n=1 Tax=Gossypium mustelinum TaxID=34275 RepID=A0A5D2UCY9_GOSMU|nr:hypothetical protein E1A91_D06G004300v1 [Gossypium mustelinum]